MFIRSIKVHDQGEEHLRLGKEELKRKQYRSAARLLGKAQDLFECGGAPEEKTKEVYRLMTLAVRSAARVCLNEGLEISQTGDHKGAALLFYEAQQLYIRIGDDDGATKMGIRVTFERGKVSRMCGLM